MSFKQQPPQLPGSRSVSAATIKEGERYYDSGGYGVVEIGKPEGNLIILRKVVDGKATGRHPISPGEVSVRLSRIVR